MGTKSTVKAIDQIKTNWLGKSEIVMLVSLIAPVELTHLVREVKTHAERWMKDTSKTTEAFFSLTPAKALKLQRRVRGDMVQFRVASCKLVAKGLYVEN